MGCKDDDTCDQPVTKGEIEGQFNINFLINMATLTMVIIGFSWLDMKLSQ